MSGKRGRLAIAAQQLFFKLFKLYLHAAQIKLNNNGYNQAAFIIRFGIDTLINKR
ncbi:hypothetical protein IDJ75_12245 [Mucilaginibacter rigui]|uniref:Uncharacterized protein n=1 Tax=Mucilaginibacter rigui TaxID=534635 RepID=A0ABR7X646_9SPHI|nr:hypothetical protein [Mucilaginibacter rigui]